MFRIGLDTPIPIALALYNFLQERELKKILNY